MSLLVLNAGSSTLKFALFDRVDGDAVEARYSGVVDWSGRGGASATLSLNTVGEGRQVASCSAADHREAAAVVIRLLNDQVGPSPIAAVGHRVVHGGTAFRESVRIGAEVRAAIASLAEVAPLHNPPALAVIEAAEAALPSVSQVAVFDTAFYADLPPAAAVFPLPYAWYADWGLRRFGFHGISHQYVATRAAAILGRDPRSLRIVSCHLGNGCSATAVNNGRAIATTMGFTPMDGLMMGTRPGAVDPGLLLHVLQRRGLSVEAVDAALNHESGLLGVSGVSSDYRAVEAAARSGNGRAQLALELFAARVTSAVGALAAAMGGLDALVFTAGIGEHAAGLRASACATLGHLGIRIDPARNAACVPDADIAADGAPARTLVIRTREEAMIARETARVAGRTT